MAKENVYTKEELMKLSTPKIKALELCSEIKTQGLKKEQIVDAMIELQNSTKPEFLAADVNKDGVVDVKDIAAITEAIEEVEEEKSPEEQTETSTKEDESEKNETEDTDEVEEEKEDVKVQKGPTFHRPIRKRNPMTFR